MKNANKITLFLMSLLLLTSCGEALEICRDDNTLFPENIDMPKFTLNNRYEYPIQEFTTRYNELPDSEKNNYKNALEYAKSTNLKDTASLPNNVKYIKLFDGEISCAGAVANSRLHLYSSGIIVNLQRNLQDANRIGIYMTSSKQTLKMKATLTLYKIVDRLTNPYTYDAYDFTFNINLAPNSLEPYYYSFLISSLNIDDRNIIDDMRNASMVGFSYERLELTEEERASGNYVEKIVNENGSDSFVKVYDISLPNSTWSRP